MEQNNELTESITINYLDERQTTFRRTSGKLLAVTIDGVTHDHVYLHCSFPHTDKRKYISVRKGEKGEYEEIGIIRSIDDFPPEVTALLEEQIRIRYFAPEITQVVHIREEFGYSYWETETTAGYCRFTVRSGGNNLKLVSEHRLLILDVDGNRFIIPDLDQLSAKEYRMVEMCM